MRKYFQSLLYGAATLLLPSLAFANGGSIDEQIEHGVVMGFAVGVPLLIMLYALQMKFERWRVPALLVTISSGIIIGQIPGVGDSLRESPILKVGMNVGLWLLIYKAALETDLKLVRRVFFRAFIMAALGVIIPFIVMFFVAPMAGVSRSFRESVVFACMITPTSLGVAFAAMSSQGIVKSETAQIAIAVAAIDDVIGLAVMNMMEAAVQSGGLSPVSALTPVGKALLFMGVLIAAGEKLAPHVTRAMAKFAGKNEISMVLAILNFGGLGGLLATKLGFSSLMGVYGAGAFLTEVNTKHFHMSEEGEHPGHHGLEEVTAHIDRYFVPIFFFWVGTKVDLRLIDADALKLIGLSLTILLIAKFAIALVLARGETLDWKIVGLATLPRGEVALVIAAKGLALGAITPKHFGAVVLTMVATAIMTAVGLPKLIAQARLNRPALFGGAPSHV